MVEEYQDHAHKQSGLSIPDQTMYDWFAGQFGWFTYVHTPMVDIHAWIEVETKRMRQHWIITDEWSEYHSIVAGTLGFALEHKGGAWEIVTRHLGKFPTDDDARAYVVTNEHDPTNAIFAIAINAVILGNMGKV